MSLRVLLADESDTIKKVFQLALQDLGAEVKSVHSGLDVMDVAKSFRPDIIFADILLQKKNGYEICLQIKQSEELSSVPVVLMWSSFMELDHDQYKKSLANDQLEKPFDADLLREIVQKHSSAAADNPMAAFLSFPKSIAAEAPVGAKTSDKIPLGGIDLSVSSPAPNFAPGEAIPLGEASDDEDTSEFNLGNLLDSPVDTPTSDADALTKTSAGSMQAPVKSLFDDLAIDAAPSTNQELWKEKDLTPFKLSEDKSDDLDKFEALNLSSTTNTATHTSTSTGLRTASGSTAKSDLDQNTQKEITLGGLSASLPPIQLDSEPASLDRYSQSKTGIPRENTATKPAIKTSTMTGMGDSEIEAIVRAHTEEVIKNQVKDSLIHVIEKIVREELNRIMEEELRLQQDADLDT